MQRKRGLSLNHIAETLFASEMFVKKAAFRLQENKTRAISDPPKRKLNRNERCQDLKMMASEMSRFMLRLTFYQLVMDADYFRRRNSCHLPS